MNKKIYRTLEFHKILTLITEKASTNSVKEKIMTIEAIDDNYILNQNLIYLNEAYNVVQKSSTIPLYGYTEISEYVIHAKKGGTIRNKALLNIASALRFSKQVKRFLLADELAQVSIPNIKILAEELEGLTYLEQSINSAVLSETELYDNASPRLYDIRRQIRQANSSIKDKLNSIITSNDTKKFLQDNIVTMRNGRYVVPIKSENKGAIRGIIHDSSSSGLTLFVEPNAVVTLNNKLRELEVDEQKEIEVIFKDFSDKIAKEANYILNNEKILLDLDFSFAKASYAYENNHTMPIFTDKKEVHLSQAFHPLIPKDIVVSNDITISNGYTQIVITGPNTGGKTVSLKTLGICSLMAKCGLFIPTKENSTLCNFDNIFADIGDEQSIAQNLSTFSAHMSNIVSIINDISPNSLVLLDELGSGTDPTEGAALAWSILNYIKEKGTISVATTHYNEIKQYALTTKHTINASMEFDVEELKPTYKLNIGLPGKSNAFEISKKLGLSDELICSAQNVLKRDNIEFEDILSQLQTKLIAASDANTEAKRLEEKNKLLNRELLLKEKDIDERKEKLITNASLEAKKIISNAKNQAKKIIDIAENVNSLGNKNYAKREIDDISKEILGDINSNIPSHSIHTDTNTSKQTQTFTKDEVVFIPELNTEATILYIENKYAMVQAGFIKTKVLLSKLEKAKIKKEKVFSYTSMKSQYVSSQLDIRGISAAEVEQELDKFIDDAILANLKCITVVHGKGDGILRKEVNRLLKTNKYVDSFRIGGLSEGGHGATIIYLE